MIDHSVRIQELRRGLRMNQQRFAAALGVAQGTVSRWEKKQQEPSVTMLEKIAVLAQQHGLPFDIFGTPYTFVSSASRKINIVGSVQRFVWKDEWKWNDFRVSSLIIPEREEWLNVEIEGFLIGDKSAELLFHESTIIFVARLRKGIMEPEVGDAILFLDKNPKGRFEVTVRKLVSYRGVPLELHIESNQSHFEEIISIPFNHPSEMLSDVTYETLGLYGVVVAILEVHRKYPRSRSA